jgi:predicted enzyme related to lactoylglutathione lyase
MKVKEIGFVTYAITDVKRAKDFYEGVLGLTPATAWESDEMAFIEYEIGPHTLAIGKGAENFKPGKTGATVALEVEDFEAAVAKVKEAGVKILMEPKEWPSCHMAVIEDPDGNQIMIHHRKEK